MKTIHVRPAAHLNVRTEDGNRHIAPDGEVVSLTTYIRRRIAAGDLVETAAAETGDVASVLADALRALEDGNPAHWTEAGKPDLNHLSDILNRRVTRREVDRALKDMEG